MIASLLMALSIANQALFPHPALFAEQHTAVWARAYERALYAEMRHNFEQAGAEVEEAVDRMDTPNDKGIAETKSTASDTQPTEVCDQTEASESAYGQGCVGVEAAEEPVPETTAEVVSAVTPLYQVDGYVPNTDLQTYLYNRLCEQGIPWFMPYAVCLIAQESTWNPMAQNKNGEDFGLLQYKLRFVPWMDWTNPYQQIDYFVAQMANRAAAGCTVSDMISRHYASDYGEYCQKYVDDVMSHSNTLVQIR